MVSAALPFIAFTRYRWLAYCQQLTELGRQLSQLGLLTVVLLGSALPAVFFLLFYGIGLVVRHPAGPLASTQQAIAVLVLQALIWYLLRPAVLDLPHRLFQRSLSRPWWRLSGDVLLLLLSAPLLWAVSVLLLTMSWRQISAAPQLFLLWWLLCCCGPLVLYRPGRLLWGLAGGLLALCLFAALWQGLAGTTLKRPDSFLLLAIFAGGALPLLAWSLPRRRRPVRLHSVWHFWWQYLLQHSWPLLWRLLLAALNRHIWQTAAQFRPDATLLWHSLALSVELLLLASWLFVCKAVYRQYQIYFQSLGQQQRFWRSQFALAALPLLSWVALISCAHRLSGLQYLLLPLIGAGLFLVIYRRPAQYLLCWCCCAGLLVLLR